MPLFITLFLTRLKVFPARSGGSFFLRFHLFTSRKYYVNYYKRFEVLLKLLNGDKGKSLGGVTAVNRIAP